jgi:hypothetical protein
MRGPFTGTLPCPLGREGAEAKLRLASLPLGRWRPGKSGQQYLHIWLLQRSSAIPEMAKRAICRSVAERGSARLSRRGFIQHGLGMTHKAWNKHRGCSRETDAGTAERLVAA